MGVFSIILGNIKNMMKKLFIIFITLMLTLLCVTGCSEPVDLIRDSLGEYESAEFFSNGVFQDFTFYDKYVYKEIDLSGNPYFEKITTETKEDLLIHVEDFERWILTFKESDPQAEIVTGYDFDVSCITEDDYLYIEDDSFYPELGCYDVYFFDMATLTLYYFHNNI